MLKRLLGQGYLPHEIPQPFTSSSFGQVVHANRNRLPGAFSPARITNTKNSVPGEHNLARVGTLRRTLSIVNPVGHYSLCREVCESWDEISQHCANSKLSATRPVYRPKGRRAITGTMGLPHRTELRVANRARGRYLLVTDIQQFYPSVYTHSIAWALHTKSIAKQKQRDNSLLGNRLDILQRSSQDRQTMGIPIGPDTSLVLAEILLTAVDCKLADEVNTENGFRIVDDYELVFETYAQAEEALAALQSLLSQFNLRLNERKTFITDLPQSLTRAWTRELRKFEISGSTADLHEYFDLAFRLAKEYPLDSVLRYALGRIRRETVSAAVWPDYQYLLCQCAVTEPGVLKYFLAELRKYKNLGMDLDDTLLTESLEKIILRHGPIGHGSELAWCLWIACALDLPIRDSVQDVVLRSDDPLVPIVALDADARGLFGLGFDTTRWRNKMRTDELWGPNWLLAYEAAIQGWLPSATNRDHIAADAAFEFLRANGVSFYNRRASSLNIPTWSDIVPVPTEFAQQFHVDAILDFGHSGESSYYGDDSDDEF